MLPTLLIWANEKGEVSFRRWYSSSKFYLSFYIWILLALLSLGLTSLNDLRDFFESIRFIVSFLFDLLRYLIDMFIPFYLIGVHGYFLSVFYRPITSSLICSIVWLLKTLKFFASFLSMNSVLFQISSSPWLGPTPFKILVIYSHFSKSYLICACINSSIFYSRIDWFEGLTEIFLRAK